MKEGFLDLIGATRTASGQLRLTVTEQLLNAHGTLHGGVSATLVDTAAGFGARSSLPAGSILSTIQLSVMYVAPARVGDVIVTTSETLHVSVRHALATATLVRESDGAVLAHGDASFAVKPPAAPNNSSAQQRTGHP